MKKFLSLLLTLCLLLGILPSQALAYVGDILPSTGSTVTTETRADGTLVLQNDYIRVTLNKHDGSLTTSPAATADSANSIDRQKPYCEFIIYGSYGYGKRCGFSKRYFLVLVACRHLTCTKTECRKMFLSLIAPLTTIRLNRGKRSNRLPYIFAQGQER